VTTTTEFGLQPVVVTPGQETSLTLAVRNDSDIVEAYTFEVLGECEPWTTVEPARLPLYPGTSERVTIRLRPPRSSAVRAGEVPLGVRVVPAERPQAVVVAETMVIIEPFGQQQVELVPERRRAWRSARYHVEVRNDGNTPITVPLAAPEADDQLSYRIAGEPVIVEPGERAEIGVRARVAKLIWFGRPVTWPLRLTATAAWPRNRQEDEQQEHEVNGELIQLPLLPRWLLALLAALLALLLAWLALVRPAVTSAAKEAADNQAQKIASAARQQPVAAPPAPAPAPTQASAQPQQGGQGSAQQGSGQQVTGTGGGQQFSSTIDITTNTGGTGVKTYVVPKNRVFHITDIVLANFQGDEGVLTVAFGNRVITTIALETFRNQDYHWVTPIDVPAGSTVKATVTCAKPGTPATGRQAANCHELLNVSGVLTTIRR
jgi:hypothetical protein